MKEFAMEKQRYLRGMGKETGWPVSLIVVLFFLVLSADFLWLFYDDLAFR